MAITEALRLVIDADTRGAVQGIEQVGNAADRELSRSKTSLDKLGHGLTTAGAGMVAFGGAALVGLGALARMSEEANLAQVKLENTLQNMPKLAGESSKQFIDLANSIQDVTAADADAIVEAEALLGTFNLTAQEIKGITPLVVDYARKFGIDIPDAAIQVGKALDGQSGALKRNGVSIDEVLFKTDRYRAVNEALSNQVGGFAEAEGKTFAGSLERMKNELGDLAEGVGGGAVDAFTDLFGVLGKVTGAMESVSPGTQETIGKVATFGAVALTAAGGASFLIGQAITMRQRFADAGNAVSTLTGHLGGMGRIAAVAGGVAGLGLLAVGIVELSKAIDDVNFDVEGFAAVLARTDDASRRTVETWIQTTEALGIMDKTFEKLLDTNVKAAERFIEAAEAAGVGRDALNEMRDAVEAKRAADAQGAVDQEAYSGEVDDASAALDKQKESTDNAKTALQEYNDALRAGLDPLFGAISASNSLADANNAVTEAEAKVAEAIRDHGEGSAEAAEAQRGLTEAQLSAAEAASREELAFNDLTDAILSQGLSTDEAKAKLDQWVAQGRITQGSADAVKGRIDELTTSLNLIPGGRNTHLSTTGSAASDAANLKARLDAIDTTKNIEINFSVRAPAGVDIGKVLTFRQHGGPVKAGEAYVVGEHRPELFVPDRDGTILPEVPKLVRGPGVASSGGAGGGGGQPEVIEIHNYLQVDGAVLAESQRRYKRNNGLDWRS